VPVLPHADTEGAEATAEAVARFPLAVAAGARSASLRVRLFDHRNAVDVSVWASEVFVQEIAHMVETIPAHVPPVEVGRLVMAEVGQHMTSASRW